MFKVLWHLYLSLSQLTHSMLYRNLELDEEPPSEELGFDASITRGIQQAKQELAGTSETAVCVALLFSARCDFVATQR